MFREHDKNGRNGWNKWKFQTERLLYLQQQIVLKTVQKKLADWMSPVPAPSLHWRCSVMCKRHEVKLSIHVQVNNSHNSDTCKNPTNILKARVTVTYFAARTSCNITDHWIVSLHANFPSSWKLAKLGQVHITSSLNHVYKLPGAHH